MKLRSHILFIGAITLIPILLVVCLQVIFLFRKMRDEQLQSLLVTARALSAALDRSFEKAIVSLNALSTSRYLQNCDLKTFHEDAKRVLAAHRDADAIALVDPQGQQIVNTRVMFGEPLPRGGGTLARAIAQRR